MDAAQEYFASLPQETVEDICAQYFKGAEEDQPDDFEEKVYAMAEDAWCAGINAIVRLWPVDLKAVVQKNLRIVYPPHVKPDHPAVMTKSLISVLTAEGFASTFNNYTAPFLMKLAQAIVRPQRSLPPSCL